MLNSICEYLLDEGFEQKTSSAEHYRHSVTNERTNLIVYFTVYDEEILLMSETKEPQTLDDTQDFLYKKDDFSSFLSAYEKAKEWTYRKLR